MKEVEINMKKNGGKPSMNATQFSKHPRKIGCCQRF
jgi:hypothetical protein